MCRPSLSHGRAHRAAGLLVGAIGRGILNLAAPEQAGAGVLVLFVLWRSGAAKGREPWEASRPVMAPAAGLVLGTHTRLLPLLSPAHCS